MPLAHLSDRRVVKVSGEETRTFLDRLVTCDLDPLAPGLARYGALLTPQGKIIADFVIIDGSEFEPHTIFIDVASACAAELIKRLNIYKLRAKLKVEDLRDAYGVLAGWGDTSPPTGRRHLVVPDPRLAALGWRALVERDGLLDAGSPGEGESRYREHRIRLGVPEGGADFAFNDAFPHEALLDQLRGVDFDKGCYVGQEVVSRMQHRGTARTRVVSLAFEGDLPPPGEEVMAGDRPAGRTASVAAGLGLATLRLDRAAEALAAGEAIRVGGTPVRLVKPDWVRFGYPGEAATSPS